MVTPSPIPYKNSMMHPDSNLIRKTAVEAAQKAGAIQMKHYETLLNVDLHERHDLKLEVDRLCEAAIVQTIHQQFADHSILAEEGGKQDSSSLYYWIIDPLDGTVNYFYGLPYFCTSIACYRKPELSKMNTPYPRDLAGIGEPLVGVVYAPRLDEMYVAQPGGGAFMNDKPIKTANIQSLSQAMVCFGFNKADLFGTEMITRAQNISTKVRKVRCLGSAACDICQVACGRLSAFFERGLRIWDIAAAAIILGEAGGYISFSELSPNVWDIVGCAPKIADELQAELAFCRKNTV